MGADRRLSGCQRQGDPAQRILVVNPESSAEHLYPQELRDALWRRPPDSKDTEALADLAEAIARHVNMLTGTFGTVTTLVLPRWVPAQRMGSIRFVGRLPEMWKIHSALHPQATAVTVGRAGPSVAQLRGLGGVGKSLLAEEYALRFAAAYPGGVFWLQAYGSHDPGDLSAEELEARRHDEFYRIAQGLGLNVAAREPDELPGLMATAIQERGEPCLWVVDDLPHGLSVDQVRDWFAPHPLACTLMTTRSPYEAIAPVIDLDVLSAEEARDLLTDRRPPKGEKESAAASRIVTQLGGHALAVDVAGAGLRNQEGLLSYADFDTRLSKPDEDDLELIAELADVLPNGHEASIACTLLRSIDKLGEEGCDVLRLAAVLAAAPVPARLIATVLGQADGVEEREAAWRAGRGLTQAESLSLATKAAGDQAGAWSVHALVARTVRFRELASTWLAALRATAIAVLTGDLRAIEDARAHTILQDVVPHARELARNATDITEAGLLGWVARYDDERGAFASARAQYEQVVDTCRRVLGEEHPDTLTSMNNLASTLSALGDLAGARTLEEQVVSANRRVLGEEHPDTLIAIGNLASTLRALGDLASAQVLQRQVLSIHRRLLGEEHPDTLTSMGNLASTLGALGDLDAARTIADQVLHARRRLLGDDHPDTLRSMNSVAEMLSALGDLNGARGLCEQALDACRRLLGEEHPDTLNSMNNLALALHHLGDLDPARVLYEQVLDARQRLLGEEHPDTLNSMNNLAGTLDDVGDPDAARVLYEQVLDARQRLLGEEHPDTLDSMNNLAVALHKGGDLGAARVLHEQVLNACRRLLGEEHPDTLGSMNNLAATLHALGDLDSARTLAEQALDAYSHLLGDQHPNTHVTRANLDAIIRSQASTSAVRNHED